jgi:hypothetical protein
MLTADFYDILDAELSEIIAQKEQYNGLFTPKQDGAKQKSIAFLVWFLQFYAPNRPNYLSYITDEADDYSCDLIFSIINRNEEIFYVVQSKWNKKQAWNSEKEEPKISNDDSKKAIADFTAILSSEKLPSKNQKFNAQYESLQQHLKRADGKVKFIFVGLKSHNPDINPHITAFEKRFAPNIKLEIIDIDRLKRDYIEVTYKKIKAQHPLRFDYLKAEDEKITLPIERNEQAAGLNDNIQVDSPYKGYVFLLKPKTLYELFEQFEFGLFIENVRNPLPKSNYNEAIAQTLRNEPAMFWYYNNGITGITRQIKVGAHSQEAELTGLQIINGAQTVYTIARVYAEANNQERDILDEEVRVMMRLIRSNNRDANLQITRYTNSQNPMNAANFWANDEVQIRIQEESFKTPYWYERKENEFAQLPEGVQAINIAYFDCLYRTFWLNEDDLVDWLATNDRPDSYPYSPSRERYEAVFNEKTTFADLLSPVLFFDALINADKLIGSIFFNNNRIFLKNSPYEKIKFKSIFSSVVDFGRLSSLGAEFYDFRLLYDRYIALKYGTDINYNKMMQKCYNDFTLAKIKYFIDRAKYPLGNSIEFAFPHDSNSINALLTNAEQIDSIELEYI